MKKIVVVGSINVDFILDVEALPQPNETIMGKGLHTTIGGKGLNQAVACARSGLEVFMVGCVGDDSFADQAVDFMKMRGVNTSHVTHIRHTSTGIANILVAQGGENMIIVSPGANGKLTPAMVDLAEDLIRGADAVVVQLETPLESVKRALELARRHAVLTLLNPAPVNMKATELFALADIITPNETELMTLTGITALDDDNLARGLQALLAAGAATAVVTLGDKGCATLVDGRLHRLPAFRVEAVDATGAGDVFNGALVSQRVQGAPVPEALRFASAASALSVTKASADAAPSEAEVLDFLSGQVAH